jgi:Flp pilus assembly protein TadG
MVEFALCSFLLLMLLFSVIEVARMALIYTTVANATRAGVRYAITHGSNRAPGAGIDNGSGPADDPDQVVTLVKNVASAGLLDTSKLTVTVRYPDTTNTVGKRIRVSAQYTYDPFNTFFTSMLNVNLKAYTEGRITY